MLRVAIPLPPQCPPLELLDCSSRGELAAHWAWNWTCGAVMGLWRQRLAQWWTVQESPGARPGTGVSGPEPPALLLTEGAKDWVGTSGRGEEGQGPLVTLCSRAISEPRIGSQRIHLGLGLCSFILCCVDPEQAT